MGIDLLKLEQALRTKKQNIYIRLEIKEFF